MVIASKLVNGNTIYQEDTDTRQNRIVEYYHLECRQHCVIFANGILGESYFDAKNRYIFSPKSLS